MLRQCDLKLVANVKVIPSDHIGPQHWLLVMDIQLDLGQHWRAWTTGTERIKWWKLPENKDHLRGTLRLDDMDLGQPVDALGKTKPGKQMIDKQIWWWNDKVQKAVKEKKAAFKAPIP
ncbi:MAG: hypothetical protein ACRCUF_12560 [Aeromonas sobria]